MTIYYQDDLVTLYHGNCLSVREWLAADVLVTDPPYGIRWTRNGISRTSRLDRKLGRYDKDNYQRTNELNDDGIDGDDTTEARDAVLAAWGATRPAFVFGSLLLPPPPGVKQVAIYKKPKDSGSLTSVSGVRRDVEAIYFIGKHPVGGGGRSAVFATGARVSGAMNGLVQRYGHPHAKPVDVLEDLIRLSPDGMVADPFAGSGSVLVAAKNPGRRAIGVELVEEYCEMAARRLSQGVLDVT